MSVVKIRNPYYSNTTDQKRLQLESHDRSAQSMPVAVLSSDVEPSRRRKLCQDFVYETKISAILNAFGTDLRGRSVLVVCAGSGDYGVRELVDRGAHVTLTDLSPKTV